jgi:UPF0755 protein
VAEQPAALKKHRASRRQVLLRRVVALAVVLGLLGVAGGAAALALRAVRGSTPPPPPTTQALPRPPKPLRIVFPEGFTRKQMAERITAVKGIAREKRGARTRISAGAYLRLTGRAPLPRGFRTERKRGSLEGFLFPATYEFLPKTTTRELLALQLGAFGRSWKEVDLAYAKSKNLTPYDVLIIASMVEKESVAREERRLIAAVIYNRLKARMELGIDATIRYGLDVPGTEPLRLSQLERDHPYNTRTRLGLPPTPIANPGLASIKAAARPANVDYLYFVRKPDKVHHFFTASEAEFYRKACEYGYGC